jgi:hypothetical protein
VPVLGAVALVSGFVVLLWPSTSSFGWFAYAPLSTAVLVAGPDRTPGWLLVVVGVALLAGWVGYRLAMRQRAD